MKAKIAGREFELDFTLAAMNELEKVRGEAELNINQLVQELSNRHTLIEVLRILIDDPEITTAWLEKHLRIGQLVRVRIAAIAAITEGLQMETEGKEDHEPAVVDVTLEEIKKKDGAEG